MLTDLYHSMFVYLIWNNKGKELNTVLEYKKALKFEEEMSKLGVIPQIVFESRCPPHDLVLEK